MAQIPGSMFIPPMLPTLVDEPPEGEGWTHEIKYDGYRTQVIVSGKDGGAYTRNGYDWTARYHKVIDAARALGRDMCLDGEMIVQDTSGRFRLPFAAKRDCKRHWSTHFLRLRSP